MQQRNISHTSSDYYSLGLISKRSSTPANAIPLLISSGKGLTIPSKFKLIAIQGVTPRSGVLPLVLLPQMEQLPSRSVPLKYDYRPHNVDTESEMHRQIFQLAALDTSARPLPSSSFALELRRNYESLLPSFHPPPSHVTESNKLNQQDDLPNNPAIQPRFFPAIHSTNASKAVNTMTTTPQPDNRLNLTTTEEPFRWDASEFNSLRDANRTRNFPNLWSLFTQ